MYADLKVVRSNRTIVGLKPAIGLLGIIAAIQGSNRTIVGLKLMATQQCALPQLWQQSHHCGIETLPNLFL